MQWHLLEHAFDAILEEGEIPHVSLFTEMIIQNLVREDYMQAIKLVNCMAHASINFSEKQWVDFFRRNMDRINQANLHRFLQILNSNPVVGEDPVLSLLNSLESIRRQKPSDDCNRNILIADLESGTSALDENSGKSDDVSFPTDETTSREHSDSYDPFEQSITDATLDSLTGDVDFSSDPEPPSANQILDSWREKRMKHGIFAKLQI